MMRTGAVVLFAVSVLLSAAVVGAVPADQIFSVQFRSFQDSSNAPDRFKLQDQLQRRINFWLGNNKTIAVLSFQNYSKVCNPDCTPFATFTFIESTASYFANLLASKPKADVIQQLDVANFAVGTAAYNPAGDNDDDDGSYLRSLTIGLIVGLLAAIVVFVGTFFCVRSRLAGKADWRRGHEELTVGIEHHDQMDYLQA